MKNIRCGNRQGEGLEPRPRRQATPRSVSVSRNAEFILIALANYEVLWKIGEAHTHTDAHTGTLRETQRKLMENYEKAKGSLGKLGT